MTEVDLVELAAGDGRAASASRGRVLLVTSNFPRWHGDSTTPFILHLAEELRDLGWHVGVVAPHAPGARVREKLEGIAVERFRYAWPESLETLCYGGGALINLRKNRWNALGLPSFAIAEASAVARNLVCNRYDLVHSHWILPQGLIVGLCAHLMRVPHILTVHGGDAFALRGRALTSMKRFALRSADAVTVNSSATLSAVSEIAGGLSDVHRIPIGASAGAPPNPAVVSQLRVRHRRGNGPLLAFVGRVVEEKGVADFLRAVDVLSVGLPDVTAMVIGDGQDRGKMEAFVSAEGLADRVTFTGWVPSTEVPNYLAAADIFVGPSKRSKEGWIEAQGLTFAEAMLAGTPVVATRVGGIVDLVRHEETGLLVSEAAPEEIARAVERLVADDRLASRLRQRGRGVAAGQFTRAASARAFSDLFERVLRGKNRTGASPPKAGPSDWVGRA